MAGEETTTVVIWPSFRLMIGPWDLARLVRDLWGLSPRARRLPMSGSGFGPGGSLEMVLVLVFEMKISHVEQRRRMQVQKKSIFCRFKDIDESK